MPPARSLSHPAKHGEASADRSPPRTPDPDSDARPTRAGTGTVVQDQTTFNFCSLSTSHARTHQINGNDSTRRPSSHSCPACPVTRLFHPVTNPSRLPLGSQKNSHHSHGQTGNASCGGRKGRGPEPRISPICKTPSPAHKP